MNQRAELSSLAARPFSSPHPGSDMTSKAATGKSTATKTARKKTTTSAKSSTSQKKSTRRKSSSATRTAAPKSTRKASKKAKAKPRKSSGPKGPPVYASDVVAQINAGMKKRSKALPETIEAHAETLELSPIPDDLPMQHWPAQILRMAEEAFAMTGSWVVFYRTMLAEEGVVSQFYTNADARRYFETTAEFAELLEMVTAMRSQDESSSGAHEPTRTITIRMPRSMHQATIREAEELELSINSYCVTKLLQPANPRYTPLEPGNRRGRRPGPQITMRKVKVKKGR